jgi:hypothetical protein
MTDIICRDRKTNSEGAETMKKISRQGRIRFASAAAVTVVLGAVLASAGVAGLSSLGSGPAAATQYPGKKVTICRKTHSKKHPWVKIRVSTHALKAHLRHGDFVVDDTHPCPPPQISAANKHHKNHKHKGGAAAKKKHGHGADAHAHGKGGTHHGNGGSGGNGNNGKHGKK